MNNRHYNTAVCRNGRNRKRLRVATVTAYEAYTAPNFTVGPQELDKVNVFCYLGRPLSYNNSDCVCTLQEPKKGSGEVGDDC